MTAILTLLTECLTKARESASNVPAVKRLMHMPYLLVAQETTAGYLSQIPLFMRILIAKVRAVQIHMQTNNPWEQTSTGAIRVEEITSWTKFHQVRAELSTGIIFALLILLEDVMQIPVATVIRQ